MTPKLPLPMLLTSRYLSISDASAKSVGIGSGAVERLVVVMVVVLICIARAERVFTAEASAVPLGLEGHQGWRDSSKDE